MIIGQFALVERDYQTNIFYQQQIESFQLDFYKYFYRYVNIIYDYRKKMKLSTYVTGKPSKALLRDIKMLASKQKYALYYDLMGNTDNSLGSEIAFLMNDNRGTTFKKILSDDQLRIGMSIGKPGGRSQNGYQSAGYAILRNDGLEQLAKEIQTKVMEQEEQARNKNRGVPLSSDANVFITHMLSQQYRTIQGLQEYMDQCYGLKIEIKQKDIESGLSVFLK